MRKSLFFFAFTFLVVFSSKSEPLSNNSIEIGPKAIYKSILYQISDENAPSITFSPFLNYYFTKYFYIGTSFEIGIIHDDFVNLNMPVYSFDLSTGFTFPSLFGIIPFFFVGYNYWKITHPDQTFNYPGKDSTYIEKSPDQIGYSIIPFSVGIKYNIWKNLYLSLSYNYTLWQFDDAANKSHDFSISLAYLFKL